MTRTADAPSELSSLQRAMLCRFNLHHNWVRCLDPESGEHYLQCIACDKDRSWAAVIRFL
jgi:hypothetical protein